MNINQLIDKKQFLTILTICVLAFIFQFQLLSQTSNFRFQIVEFEQNPLFHAISHNDSEGAIKLIDNATNINQQIGGITPLMFSIIEGQTPVAEYLLQKQADLKIADSHGRTALMWAASYGRVEIMQELLKGGALVETKDSSGQTALMYAAEAGQDGGLNLLLANGALVEARDKTGFTPLFYAAKDGRTEIIKILTAKGANINAQDDSGVTPLIVAILTGQTNSAIQLFQTGADPLLKTKAGLCARDYAGLCRHPELLSVFDGKPAVSSQNTNLINNGVGNTVILNSAATSLDNFRMAAAGDVDSAISKWGSSSFTEKWKQEMGPLFTNAAAKNLLMDFFSSAVVVQGEKIENQTIRTALYNPWVDEVMLVKVKSNGLKVTLDDFCLIAGETWRNEKIDPSLDLLKLYTSRRPLAVKLVELCEQSKTNFMLELNKPEPDSRFIPDSLKTRIGTTLEEWRPGVARLLFRSQMFQALFAPQNKAVDQTASDLIKRLKVGDAASLREYLSPSQDEKALDIICGLPKSVRARFCPNYFAGGPKESIVCLVNPSYPTIFILVQFKLEGAQPDIRIEMVPLFQGYSGTQLGKESQ